MQVYCHVTNKQLRLTNSNLTFRFRDKAQKSIRHFGIRIPPDQLTFIKIYADVVKVDVPLLIGLTDLKTHNLSLDYIKDALIHHRSGSRLLVTYENGHSFIERVYTDILFTRTELTRLHLYFLYPA